MDVKTLVRCGLFSALIAITAWIAVPFAVPFTMQTFGIFCTLLILGGKQGTISIAVYILLGAVGLPVFAGFQGGIGIIFSQLGGFIIGFVLIGFVYLISTKLFGNKIRVRVAALAVGLILCYTAGVVWYILFNKGTDFMAAFTACVLPFIIPDVIKLWLAASVAKRIKQI